VNEISTLALFVILAVLLVLSGLFSGSETGLMTLNRYRLRHLSKAGHRGARLAERLLQRPDRIIGLILLGNNFVNIAASMLTTIITLRLFDESALAIAAGLLTLVILLFSEVLPKTFAALRPERIAFPASFVYWPLLKVLYPLVWVVNLVANGILKLFGLSSQESSLRALSGEELRTVVLEAGAMIPRRHQKMLLSILDLQKVTVEDIMVPRNEIVGIDIDEPWDEILDELVNSQHTRLPVFHGSIDHTIGMVHMRRLLNKLARNQLDRDTLLAAARDCYFTPEGTPLNTQLLNFQREKRRIALVVDEYGDIQGLVTLEDILEEIVGEFTSDPASMHRDVFPQPDGTWLVTASANIRHLNRSMGWHLPDDGPKTLNGLITEYLETIPEPGTSVKFNDYPLEIVQTQGNAIKTVRVSPRIRKPVTHGEQSSKH